MIEQSLAYEPILRNTIAWKRYSKAIDKHNMQYMERQFLKMQIRNAYVLTARAIFSDFLRAKKAGLVVNGYYQTSDALLMEATKAPRRTVRGHIKRLLEVGFILSKVQNLPGVYKVREYNYFLQVNPGFYKPTKKPP